MKKIRDWKYQFIVCLVGLRLRCVSTQVSTVPAKTEADLLLECHTFSHTETAPFRQNQVTADLPRSILFSYTSCCKE